MKKSELISAITEIDTSVITNGLSKSELESILSELQIKSSVMTTTVETETAVTPIIDGNDVTINKTSISTEIVIPDRHSPEWSDYVMSLFTEQEKIDGYPTADGLRRLTNLIVGRCFNVNMEIMQCPNPDNENRAVVKCTLQVLKEHDRSIDSISDVADCYIGNTKEPYSRHPTATAATMAESRALRKLLGLRTISKEEASITNDSEAAPATSVAAIKPTQKTVITHLCSKFKIDQTKLLQSLNKNINLEALNITEAYEVINELQIYSRGPDIKGGKIIPKEILQ